MYEIDTNAIYKYKGVEIPGDELMSNFIDGLKFKKLHHELKGGKHE